MVKFERMKDPDPDISSNTDADWDDLSIFDDDFSEKDDENIINEEPDFVPDDDGDTLDSSLTKDTLVTPDNMNKPGNINRFIHQARKNRLETQESDDTTDDLTFEKDDDDDDDNISPKNMSSPSNINLFIHEKRKKQQKMKREVPSTSDSDVDSKSKMNNERPTEKETEEKESPKKEVIIPPHLKKDEKGNEKKPPSPSVIPIPKQKTPSSKPDKESKKKEKQPNVKKKNKKKRIFIVASLFVVFLLLASVLSMAFLSTTTDDSNDTDSDGDGIPDSRDAFPNDAAASVDSDGDGFPDSWNPGYSQQDSTTGLIIDEFPLSSTEWIDSDNDGIGNNEDEDDDNDGVTDVIEDILGTDSEDSSDRPSDKEIEIIDPDAKDIKDFQSRGIIIYDESGENYIKSTDENVGYFIPSRSNTRADGLNYSDMKEVLLPEGFSSVSTGSFDIITSDGVSTLIDHTPGNVSEITDFATSGLSSYELDNINIEINAVSICYDGYTYGVGISDDRDVVFVGFDNYPLFFTTVIMQGTVVPKDLFTNMGVFNIDLGLKLDDIKEKLDITLYDKETSFVIVNDIQYPNMVVEGDVYSVIRPDDVSNLAGSLSTKDISKFTNFTEKLTQQLVILGDINNTVSTSDLWFIWTPLDYNASSLEGIVKMSISESDISYFTKRMSLSVNHDMKLKHRIRVGVTAESNSQSYTEHQETEVRDLHDMMGVGPAMVGSVSVDTVSLIIDSKNLLTSVAQSLEADEDTMMMIKAITSFRNPGLAFMLDEQFADMFDNTGDRLWDYGAFCLFPNFEVEEPEDRFLDSMVYHINVKGVVYDLWNYLKLDVGTIDRMPLIIADSYSIAEVAPPTTLQTLVKEPDLILGEDTVVVVEVEGFIFGTTVKTVSVAVANAIEQGAGDIIEYIPVDIGIYDLMDFELVGDKVETYHVPLVTLVWGTGESYIGNHTMVRAIYVDNGRAINQIRGLAEKLMDKVSIDDWFKEQSEDDAGGPFFHELMDTIKNGPVQIANGFLLAVDMELLEPEVSKSLGDFYKEREDIMEGEVKKHIEIEGVCIGTTLKTVCSEADSLPYDVGLYMLFDRTGEKYPFYNPYYVVPMIYIVKDKGPTYLGKPVAVDGIFVSVENLKERLKDSLVKFLGKDDENPFGLVDQIATIQNLVENVVKPLDGFILVYHIKDDTQHLQPPNLEIVDVSTEDCIWIKSDPNDGHSVPLPDNPWVKDGEWDFAVPRIQAGIKNTGGKATMANLQFVLKAPSGKTENVNGTSFPVESKTTAPGYAWEMLDEPEVGTYEVNSYLFKNGTYKEYVGEDETSFNVKQLSGHISANGFMMKSWQTKDLSVEVTNTGTYLTQFKVMAMLIPDHFGGMYIKDGTPITLNLLRIQTTPEIMPDDTSIVDFNLRTMWSGGMVHLFLFRGDTPNAQNKIANAFDTITGILGQQKPGQDLIFNSVDAMERFVMLSYDSCEISFDYAEEIIGANAIASKNYYFGDGIDGGEVEINVTVRHNHDLMDYLPSWDWVNRQLNITIYKDGKSFEDNVRVCRLLDLPSFPWNTDKNHKFTLEIEPEWGYGDYTFDIYLMVEESIGKWRHIDNISHNEPITISIVDAEINMVYPNHVEINNPNNFFWVRIYNTGNLSWSFTIYVHDENSLTKKWLPATSIPTYTIKDTITSLQPNDYDYGLYYIDSRQDSVNASFEVYILPESYSGKIDSQYHSINVGPQISNVDETYLSNSATTDIKFFTSRQYYIYCTLNDENPIGYVHMEYDDDGSLVDDIDGSITMTQYSGSIYRTISPIPKYSSPRTVIYRINATDGAEFPESTILYGSYYIEYDSGNSVSSSTLATIDSNKNENIGYANDNADLFRIYLTASTGRILHANLTVPLLSNFNLYLYNSSLIQQTSSTNGLGQNEYLEYLIPTSGWYYVQVWYSSGLANSYSISFEYGTLDDIGDSFVESTVVSKGLYWYEWIDFVFDAYDYYKIYLTSGNTLYVNTTVPSGLDIDLYLYDPSQVQKDSSTGGWGVDEQVQHTATQTGWYYVKVFAPIGFQNYGNYWISFEAS